MSQVKTENIQNGLNLHQHLQIIPILEVIKLRKLIHLKHSNNFRRILEMSLVDCGNNLHLN